MLLRLQIMLFIRHLLVMIWIINYSLLKNVFSTNINIFNALILVKAYAYIRVDKVRNDYYNLNVCVVAIHIHISN